MIYASKCQVATGEESALLGTSKGRLVSGLGAGFRRGAAHPWMGHWHQDWGP